VQSRRCDVRAPRIHLPSGRGLWMDATSSTLCSTASPKRWGMTAVSAGGRRSGALLLLLPIAQYVSDAHPKGSAGRRRIGDTMPRSLPVSCTRARGRATEKGIHRPRLRTWDAVRLNDYTPHAVITTHPAEQAGRKIDGGSFSHLREYGRRLAYPALRSTWAPSPFSYHRTRSLKHRTHRPLLLLGEENGDHSGLEVVIIDP
jgi:hypothetical protein